MRVSTIAMAAAAGVASAQQSICDKYTTALLKTNNAANQYTLVTLLVKTAALGNFTGPGTMLPNLPGSMYNLSGLLAPGMVNGEMVNLAPYFTGELASTNVNGMPAGVNWLDGGNMTRLVTDATYVGDAGTQQNTLLTHLIQYFGVLLGCSGYGKTGYAAYAGSNNQYSVHKYMDLSEAEFMWFNMNVGYAALSFGASQADATAAGNSLNQLFGYRCAKPVTVVPDTPAEPQVMCQGSGCPLATGSMLMAGCSGQAAVAGYTPTDPATATVTVMDAAAAATGSASNSAVLITTAVTSGTAVVTEVVTSVASGTIAAATGAAPRQTAAAGALAGLVAAGALLL